MYAEINKELEKKYVLSDYPLNLGIEVTNHCNLNCVMCNNDKITRPKGFMSMDLYKKIIDETAIESPGSRIWLDFYGEALLAGWKLYYMIDYAKKAGLTNVCINTNGTLLKKEYADMLLDSGVDYISIDCDGYSKEVYEAIRVNADRDVFYANVEYLLSEKRRRNSETIIDVKVIDMEENHHEIEKILEHWRKYGAWTAVRKCSTWVLDGDKNIVDNSNRIACGHAIGTAAISWDGMVAGCAWDCDCKMVCGNVLEESLKSIWGKRNNTFLKLHLEHQWDKLPQMCRGCSDWKSIGEMRYNENGVMMERNYKTDGKIY